MNKKLIILGLGALMAVTQQSAHAQLAIAGNFNGWDNTGVPTPGTDPANPAITTNIMTGGTADAYHEFKFIKDSGSWGTSFPGNNVKLKYDAAGSNTVYFYTNSFGDGWAPLANRVGFEDPGNMAWEITGDFTSGGGWSAGDTAAQMGVQPGSPGLYTNIYVIATPGTHNFKFRTPGTWSEVNFGSDFGNGSGNAVVVTSSSNQPVLFQLDLRNGRWQAGGPPAYCDVQFAVDMTLVQQTDVGFDPASVTVNGGALSPGGWGGTAMTNNPTAPNTNVYTSPYFNIQVGTAVEFQYRYISSGNTVYDAEGGISGNNRDLVVPNMSSTNLPTVYFNDALPTDLLNVETVVTFYVNMTNAVGTDAHMFDSGADFLFINGDFSGWLTWNPISLAGAGLQCQVVGSSLVYSYQRTFPAGASRAVTYKYSINGADNEAGYAQNHFHYIRSTNGIYDVPMDTFGSMTSEPKVGGLTIGTISGGAAPISWLPYPNVLLQTSSDPAGPWQDVSGTTGGSSTNWPAGSSATYFRLKQ